MIPSILFKVVCSGRIERSKERASTAHKSATKSDIYAKLCIHIHCIYIITHTHIHTHTGERMCSWKHEWDSREDKRKKISDARAGNPVVCLVLLVVRWPTLLECINHFDGDAWTWHCAALYLTELFSVYTVTRGTKIQIFEALLRKLDVSQTAPSKLIAQFRERRLRLL